MLLLLCDAEMMLPLVFRVFVFGDVGEELFAVVGVVVVAEVAMDGIVGRKFV